MPTLNADRVLARRFDNALAEAFDSGDHGFAEVMRAAVAGLVQDAELRARLRWVIGAVSERVEAEHLRRLRLALLGAERQTVGWQAAALDVLDGPEGVEVH